MKVLCAWGGGASWTRPFSPPASTLLSPSLVAKKALSPAGDVKGDLLGPAVRLRRAERALRQPGEPRGTGAGEHRT